jgi:hypothetical protein
MFVMGINRGQATSFGYPKRIVTPSIWMANELSSPLQQHLPHIKKAIYCLKKKGQHWVQQTYPSVTSNLTSTNVETQITEKK